MNDNLASAPVSTERSSLETSHPIRDISTSTTFNRYKIRFITVLLLVGYTFLHIKLTGVFVSAALPDFMDFSVRLPFGQRLLVPTLAHVTRLVLPLQTDEIFFLLELAVISLFWFTLWHLLLQEFPKKQATLLSWLFMLLLPLITVINYRIILSGEMPFFFPYDSPALFFTTAGLLFCLQERWRWFVLLIFLSTLNRENGLLLVLLIPALHWQSLRSKLKPLGWAFLAFLMARLLVSFLARELPGQYLEFFYSPLNHFTRFEANLYCLMSGQQLLFFLFCFAGLPLFWFAFYDYIPYRYRPLRYLTLAYFLALLLVGNVLEARIFGEIVVMLYLPVCLALKRWLTDQTREYDSSFQGAMYYINRHAILGVLILIVAFSYRLNQAILWLSNQGNGASP